MNWFYNIIRKISGFITIEEEEEGFRLLLQEAKARVNKTKQIEKGS